MAPPSNRNSKTPFDNVEIGDQVEAQEKNIWYRAKVTEVYKSVSKFRIHYLGWNKKWDKTVPFDTNIVQWPLVKTEPKTEHKFTLGQKVMAPFSDKNKYPGEILKVHESTKVYAVKVRVNTTILHYIVDIIIIIIILF